MTSSASPRTHGMTEFTASPVESSGHPVQPGARFWLSLTLSTDKQSRPAGVKPFTGLTAPNVTATIC